MIGKIKDDTPVTDDKNGIEYKLHRYRNVFDENRFSLHIRFKNTNDMLIRIDIHNGTHINPDGTKIGENHMHTYKRIEGVLEKDKIATELPKEINDLSSLFTVLSQFLDYTNTHEV
ncbi:hypothetical protein M3M39_03275 [Fructilactobacillus hinvesii]|uniref:Uncharacterized protein n=2 Tax=Fructilactobacillus hinvesii TaxID=2940300 RepID=A0ABY5BTP8_9LACO|nr:hypothetical protein [Fructilactobacillus hinvesii]USS88509.1 hypothetical protein M3M39_03275 [Fructilactobacillus hinvesii]